MKYFIRTFGCQMNDSDSVFMGQLLQKAGYQQAATLEEAEIIVINTCCVRQSAENKITGFIGNLKKPKREGQLRLIVVCGCMVQKEGSAEKFLKQADHIDILIGTFAMGKLLQYIEQALATGQKIVDIEEKYDDGDLAKEKSCYSGEGECPLTAQISIIYGCNNFCSYCIVPYVRGRERSKDPHQIIDEVRHLAAHGCKEIQLLGQNVNSYGYDLHNGWDFKRLLQELNDIEGLARIRYMTSHPKDFSLDLVDAIAHLPKVCRHFHLPLQSGCDKILSAMNRGYTTAYYRRLLSHIRNVFPDASVTSDLIIGFPGESDEDFAETLAFVGECAFDAAYTFLYSPRSGTPAAKITDQVPQDVKKARMQSLMDVQNPISLANNQKQVGKILPVLIEGKSKTNKDFLTGHSDTNKIVVIRGQAPIGQISDIRITEAQTWNLFGEPF